MLTDPVLPGHIGAGQTAPKKFKEWKKSFPNSPAGSAREQADAMMFLLSDQPSLTGGQLTRLEGGHHT